MGLMPHVNSLGFVKFIDYNILTVSDINRSSGCRHHAAMSPERRDSEGESRRDLAVGERSLTHGPPTLPETGVRQDENLPSVLGLQPLHG